jgi:beta-glucanase (GH16 family)
MEFLVSRTFKAFFRRPSNGYWRRLSGIRFMMVIIVICASVTGCQTGLGEYSLVWADEFDTDGPPLAANWSYEQGFVRNQELQWYQVDNAFCESGLLIIEGRQESVLNPDYDPASSDWRKQREYAEYTSSSLHSSGKVEFQYGKFELRARIDTRSGLWPAFWTLGISGEWPSRGEIDIMEYYQGKILANAAWGTGTRWTAAWDSASKTISSFSDPDWADKFHIWRLEWTRERLILSMDDLVMNTVDLSATINPNTAWGPSNPFHQPHYMLLNLAIGGTAGGDPSTTVFPARYEIDYVRVYQRR